MVCFKKCFLSLAVLATLSACSEQAPVEPVPELGLKACRFEAHDRMMREAGADFIANFDLTPELGDALCGTLMVHENRQTMQGRKIGIEVTVLPALGPADARQPDPLFLFVGGPGGAVSWNAFIPNVAYRAIRETRDIVLVDQRGTGGSAPLACMNFNDMPPQAAFQELLPLDAVIECRDTLMEGHDLTQYTTVNAVEDLEDVRRALGYEQINMAGSSYGTRPPMVYMRRYPDHVRTVFLQGIAPITSFYPLGFAQAAQNALEGILDACLQDTECSTAFPDPYGDLARVIERLETGTVMADVPHPGGEGVLRVSLDKDVVIERLRSRMYTAAGAVGIPSMLNYAAENGDFGPWAGEIMARAAQFKDGEFFFSGMWLSVTCSEGTPFVTDEMVRANAEGSIFTDYRVRRHRAACAVWPRASLPAGYRDPVVSDIPTLVIAGTYDPATPPEGTRAAVRHYSNALVVNVAEGHGPTDRACTARVMTAFIEAGTTDGLDTSCLEAVTLPPFQTGAGED